MNWRLFEDESVYWGSVAKYAAENVFILHH